MDTLREVSSATCFSVSQMGVGSGDGTVGCGCGFGAAVWGVVCMRVSYGLCSLERRSCHAWFGEEGHAGYEDGAYSSPREKEMPTG